MLVKFYDFVIRKHLEILAVIFIVISLLFLSQTENHVIISLQTKWQDVSAFMKKPVLEMRRKRLVMEENQGLRMEIFRLKRELAGTQSLRNENSRLRDMLAFRDSSRYEILPALIVYKGFKEGSSIIMLDKGRTKGVAENDVIVYKDGLVGRVLSAGRNSSMASMITEPDVRVSVRIDPARVYGILKWHHGNTFMIDDIPTSVDIKPGLRVTTSGFSDIYPADIPVGEITRVSSSENGFTYLIEGDYFVEFKKLREVFILGKNGS